MKSHLLPKQGQGWRWILLHQQLQLGVLNDVDDGDVQSWAWGKGPKDASQELHLMKRP
jgi:hypothetical protein